MISDGITHQFHSQSWIPKIKDENSYPLTIGELLDKLNQFEDDEEITLTNGNYLDGEWGSYRGYYNALYINETDDDIKLNTVYDLRFTLNQALEARMMEGYKGGDFPIRKDTDVYLARYSELGEAVVELIEINGEILLITNEHY